MAERTSSTTRRPATRRTEPRPKSDQYLLLLDEAMAKFLTTEQVFTDVIAEYRTGDRARPDEPEVIADRRALSDPRIRTAIADGQWQRERARTFALASMAHRLREAADHAAAEAVRYVVEGAV